MELVWLVYAISLLPKLGLVSFLMILLGGIISLICWFAIMCDGPETVHRGFLWFTTIVPVVGLVLAIALPSEKTAYTMVGAYAAQKVAESPDTQEIAKDVIAIINSKVKAYAVEATKDLEKVKDK